MEYDKPYADALVRFSDVVKDHKGTFLFCFYINCAFHAGQKGLKGKGKHTKVVLAAKKTDEALPQIPKERTLTLDFWGTGTLALQTFDFNVGTWRKPKLSNPKQKQWIGSKPSNIKFELWANTITKEKMVNCLADVWKHISQTHKYSKLVGVPIMSGRPGEHWGQNCTTYSLQFARKAGFSFVLSKLFGSNPIDLHDTLERRTFFTNWEVWYKPR